MKNRHNNNLAKLKHLTYSIMVLGFVMLTSCLVKNSLLSVISAHFDAAKAKTNYAYNCVTGDLKCAIGDQVKSETEKDTLKDFVSFTTIGFVLLYILKYKDYHRVVRIDYNLFKSSGPPVIWLFICTFRL